MFSETPDPGTPIDLLTGLTAYWKMEESPNTTREDSTANNLDLSSGTATGRAGGIIGFAADLFYPDSWLRNASASFNAAGLSMSISTWIRSSVFSSNAGEMPIISKTGGDLAGYQIKFDGLNKGIVFGVGDGGTMSFYLHPEIVTDGVWYHVVVSFTFGSSLLDIYVNNVKSTQLVSEVMANSADPFTVGEWSGTVFDGRVDETAAWIGRALTEAEVDYLWNSGAGRTYPL